MADFSTKTYCGVGMCCPYCKYLNLVEKNEVYCKKQGHLYWADQIKFCGKFKPKKNLHFYPIPQKAQTTNSLKGE